MSVHHPPQRYSRDPYEGYDMRSYVGNEYQYRSRNGDYYAPYDSPYDYNPQHRMANGSSKFDNVDSAGYHGEFFPHGHRSGYQNNSSRQPLMDIRDPTLEHIPPQRVRTSSQYIPADVIAGLESISLHPNTKKANGKKAKQQNTKPAREFEGVGALGLSPTNKPYHDPRRERKTAGDGSEPYRMTWSQTRRIQNLNRPMIPVSIKIPLHDKHLWWESPTVTLNMFAPYSHALVNGEKTIETRNYQLPNKCKGVRIGIVEIMPKNLPSKKPELIGEVVFVDCKEYTSKEEWEQDAPYHKVDLNDERFGWKKNKKKFGWVVHTWQAYDRAIREAASEYCNTRVHYTKNFFVWAYV